MWDPLSKKPIFWSRIMNVNIVVWLLCIRLPDNSCNPHKELETSRAISKAKFWKFCAFIKMIYQLCFNKWINPLRAKLFWGNNKVYLNFGIFIIIYLYNLFHSEIYMYIVWFERLESRDLISWCTYINIYAYEYIKWCIYIVLFLLSQGLCLFCFVLSGMT